jgi:hypothetical protein
MKSGNLKFLEPSGPLQAYNGTALPLPLLYTLFHICLDQTQNYGKFINNNYQEILYTIQG